MASASTSLASRRSRNSLTKSAASHSSRGVQDPLRRLGAVGREQVEVWVPLDQVAGGGDRDDDARAGVLTEAPADELGHGLGGGPPQFGEQLAPSAEQRTQQPRDRQDDVAVGDLGEHLLAQPHRPEELSLLLARGAEGPAAAGERDQHAAAALGAPQPGEAMLEQTAAQELPQDAFDDRSQRAVLAGEAFGPDPKQSFQMPLDELEKGRLARLPRPVDPATDLHAQPQAGGRVAGTSGGRTARLPRSQVSPGSVPGQVNTAAAGDRKPQGCEGESVEKSRPKGRDAGRISRPGPASRSRSLPACPEPGGFFGPENQSIDLAVEDDVRRRPVCVAPSKPRCPGPAVVGEDPLLAVAVLEVPDVHIGRLVADRRGRTASLGVPVVDRQDRLFHGVVSPSARLLSTRRSSSTAPRSRFARILPGASRS